MTSEAPYLGQGCTTPYPRREVLLRWLWAFVQGTLFRWSPRPLHRWRAWLLRLFGADIPAEHQERIDRYTRELIDKLEQVVLAALKDRQPIEQRPRLVGRGRALL